jgi:hypothetical protein
MGLAFDQTGIEQHLDVLGDGRLSQWQGFSDIAAATLSLLLAGKKAQNIEPDRMAQSSHDVGNVVVVHGIASVNRHLTINGVSRANKQWPAARRAILYAC